MAFWLATRVGWLYVSTFYQTTAMSNQLRWLIQTFNAYFMMVVDVAEFYLLKMGENTLLGTFN